MSYNKDKDDKTVYDNKLMIKYYSLGSFFDKELGARQVSFFRTANAKTYFLHYDIYIKILCTTLNLSLHQNVSV